jgi:acetolactate synthase-1/2/3 large subunit
MHLNDSFAHTPGISITYNHHEQASAIAAEGYFRASGKIACVNVTTGPGGLNTLTGVMGQWTDSIPAIYVSGQVKFETTISSCPDVGLRQLGDQEVDVVTIVRPIVKYAVQLRELERVGYELEKAYHIATSGRFGPVWIDVPMNIQGSLLDENRQIAFAPKPRSSSPPVAVAKEVARRLENAKRPVLVAGHGVRLSGGCSELEAFIQKAGIPVLTTLNGYDLIANDNPAYVGRIGTIGSRPGNFALQNADLVLCVGTRNNVRQISYNWENFCHRAYKIVVDIDPAELRKPTLVPDMPIEADARAFLTSLVAELGGDRPLAHSDWLSWCRARKSKYPVVTRDLFGNEGCIHPYVFIEMLTTALAPGSIVVTANGTASVALFQAGVVRAGVRIIGNSGTASMGYDLPATLGAADAAPSARIVCVAGDGSAQMNLQELVHLLRYGNRVAVLYLNNDGYSSIRQTQDGFFRRRVGSDTASGLVLPDMSKLAPSIGYEYVKIDSEPTAQEAIDGMFTGKGPTFYEVVLPKDYTFAPKLSSERLPDGRMVSKPLEDMYPFLPKDELESNMIRD